MPVVHAKVSGITDAADTTLVRPSDWNASHVVMVNLATETTGLLPITSLGTGTGNISQWTNDAGYLSSVSGNWTGTFDGQEGTYYLARANHTGTQLKATISDFVEADYAHITGTETITGAKLFTNAATKVVVNNSNANAQFAIEQSGTGDASVQFLLTGIRAWVVGIDNSDSDKFKISAANDGFASPLMSMTTAGVTTFANTLTASNLSGTNTGDQTITLTGDATGSGTGSFSTTVAAINGVAYNADPLVQYALLAGRPTPQQFAFGNTSGANTGYLTSTAHATKGKYGLNSALTSVFDELNERLGLGVASPNEQLEIAKNFRLPASTSSVGIIYSGANRYIHNQGTQNFFAGAGAGNLSSTSSRNVGIGDQVLKSITSGNDNVVLGSGAGSGITTGGQNFALGQRTLEACTNGSRNVAIGNGAMLVEQRGSHSIGIGDAALANEKFTSDTDVYNVAVGDSAGAAITTGTKNTLLGGLANVSSATINNVIAIGYSASVGTSNTGVLGGTGSNAVLMGVCAGISTTYAKFGGIIFDHFADAANSTTTETDLYSDTIPASALNANGQKIIAEYGGVFVSSGTATREIKIYFGGTAIFDTGALTLSLSSAWTAYTTLIRVSATVIRYMVSFTTEGAALSAYTAVGELTGLTLSNTNVLKITGQAAGIGAASNDIVAKLGTVSWEPAA